MTGPVGVDSDFPRYVQNMSVGPHLFQVDESNVKQLSVDWSLSHNEQIGSNPL